MAAVAVGVLCYYYDCCYCIIELFGPKHLETMLAAQWDQHEENLSSFLVVENQIEYRMYVNKKGKLN